MQPPQCGTACSIIEARCQDPAYGAQRAAADLRAMCDTCLLAWWGCDPSAAAAVSALQASGNTLLGDLEEAERVMAGQSQGPAWADDFWQQVKTALCCSTLPQQVFQLSIFQISVTPLCGAHKQLLNTSLASYSSIRGRAITDLKVLNAGT